MDPQMPHTVSTAWRFQVPIRILKALESPAVKETYYLWSFQCFPDLFDHVSVLAYHLFPSHETLGKCSIRFFYLFSWICLK